MATHDVDPAQQEWRISPELRRQLLAALSSTPGQLAKLTYEEFLDWADEDTHAEWVDGEVVMPSPVSVQHQRIVNFLIELIRRYAALNDLGDVLDGPFQMKLEHSGREPDVLFVARGHVDRIQENFLAGPADLVVEVVSPESVGRDRGEKFMEYQQAGIPEYWLFDPRTERAEIYHLDANGAYQTMASDANGAYQSSALPGFWLRPSWLWQPLLPDVDDVLLQIAGERYARYLMDRIRQRGFPTDE